MRLRNKLLLSVVALTLLAPPAWAGITRKDFGKWAVGAVEVLTGNLLIRQGTLEVITGHALIRQGDVAVTNAAKGLVLKESNGTQCRRISVDNIGILSVSSAFACP